MLTALIFGAAGQDGTYLTRLLESLGVQVVAASRQTGVDVSDYAAVEKFVESNRPDYIFHFAATSTTRHDAIFENHAAISTGALNILESARRHAPESRVFLPGSAMQFENHGEAIGEDTPFSAGSPYAVSRIQATYAGRYYRQAFGLRVYTGFLFNHDSPLRSERHVNQKIAATAVRIAGGSPEKLTIGDWSVQKEFNYAGDIVAAIWMLVNQEAVFEAVIGSGQAHSIAEWLEICFSAVQLNWKDHVTLSEGYKPEYQRLVSRPALLFSLGWRPRVGIRQLAGTMMGVLEEPL